MKRTLAEKILSASLNTPVAAGDVAIVSPDLVFVVDSSGPLVFQEMEDMGLSEVAHPERTVIIIDHNVPSPRLELSQEHELLRRKAAEYGLKIYDAGSGICHQIVLEELGKPGGVTVGSDSHTCTAGALCNFAVGLGASDVAVVMGTGQTWLRVPETIEVRVNGRLRAGVFAKDLILEIERRLGADGATYKALEFTGTAVPTFTVSERATLANMAVEMGGKAALFPSDDQTRIWLERHGRVEDWAPIPIDTGATYEATVDVDCTTLEPLIACPHQPDQVRPVHELLGVPIHHVFIGTCTNARLDDVAIAAQVLKGRKVHAGTQLMITPSSRTVLMEAIKLGYIETLVKAGALIGVPGCGACFGMHSGIPADGQNVLSTQNRNFKGRMGNPRASIYLGSPAVAAASAVTGMITDPTPYVSNEISVP